TVLPMITLFFVPPHPAPNHILTNRFRMLTRPLRRVTEFGPRAHFLKWRRGCLLRRRRRWLRRFFRFWRWRAIAHTDAARSDALHPHRTVLETVVELRLTIIQAFIRRAHETHRRGTRQKR